MYTRMLQLKNTQKFYTNYLFLLLKVAIFSCRSPHIHFFKIKRRHLKLKLCCTQVGNNEDCIIELFVPKNISTCIKIATKDVNQPFRIDQGVRHIKITRYEYAMSKRMSEGQQIPGIGKSSSGSF